MNAAVLGIRRFKQLIAEHCADTLQNIKYSGIGGSSLENTTKNLRELTIEDDSAKRLVIPRIQSILSSNPDVSTVVIKLNDPKRMALSTILKVK